jgi:hypothetical protein
VQWNPPSIVSHDQAGMRLLDTARAAQIGTFHINADTNGAFVRFEVLKSPDGGPAMTRDPYVRRFAASK